MKKILCVISIGIFSLILSFNAGAQGCVAIRGNGATCLLSHPDSVAQRKWTFGTNYRYFKSYKHYKGKDEQYERQEQNTEVINYSTAVDLTLARNLGNRWSVMVDVPLLANTRSSLYEHGLVNGAYIKKERRSMHSYGLGDIRVAAYRWMLDPAKNQKFNFQLGLGIKFASGQYDYQDYWYNVGPDTTKELRTVDQSIQLGDGGTGITFELNTFYNVAKHLNFYGNFYYLSNPREHNGVRTYRETLAPSLYNEDIMSVPDQYMARFGFNYAVKKLQVGAGLRWEGIPVYDLIGGSGYFRRPGYVMSLEPSINYSFRKVNVYAAVPVALVRNRTQSVTDKEYSEKFNTFKQGDAAFADYSVNVGVAFKF